jgi:hypothetical protein
MDGSCNSSWTIYASSEFLFIPSNLIGWCCSRNFAIVKDNRKSLLLRNITVVHQFMFVQVTSLPFTSLCSLFKS